MGFRDQLTALVVGLFFERPARNRTLAELARDLETSGQKITTRLGVFNESLPNRIQLLHIVGIERWGQRRLRVALGEPPLLDEYDDYRPDSALAWDELRTTFGETRRETVQLAQTLIDQDVDGATLVRHNQFGPLSIRGWLHYLNTHANIESRRIT
ncbi:MAG: hypothetical protein GFH27_549371n3 [Chloroflexi bacterium AL-W]|nr:hypothetical protein [Chloroflexi bacterium AL-N1]NOK70864.1 hypothetical protein [Chloroflexi bacterium AL-N10]NOK78533.1 hypothetical protein [Chloroflexi bacterium AL-N5]NOK85765.1 hypothetical protein [Chloroflexi bacterium AL-W]NOK92681.1 hypothetical protein [Chloroflexi bacterium AL-N15]